MRPGALKCAVDPRGGRVEHGGDVRGGPRQHVAEDQHGPLPSGQILQRRDEREPDASPRGDDARRVVAVTAQQGVRHRLQPCDVRGCGGHVHPMVVGRRAETGRQRPPGSVLQRAQAGPRRDRVEPAAQRRAALEPLVAAPRPHVRLLHGVFGVVQRAQHAVAVREQLRAERVGRGGEVRYRSRVTAVLLGRDRRMTAVAVMTGTACSPLPVSRYSVWAGRSASPTRPTISRPTRSGVRIGCIPSTKASEVDALPSGVPGDASLAPRAVAGVSCGSRVTNRMPSPSRVDSVAAYPLMNRIVAFAPA